jgi:hypothetical protein
VTPSETAELLARCAAFDRRTTGDADVAAWHQIVGDLDLQDCVAAVVEHYRQPAPPWCMPSHIRTAVLAKRPGPNDRSVRAALGPATPGDYASGAARARAALSNAGQPEHTPEFRAARHTAQTVPCPHCHAPAGQPCIVNGADRFLERIPAHHARRDLAAGIA